MEYQASRRDLLLTSLMAALPRGQSAQSGADDHQTAGCAAVEDVAALSSGQRRYLCTDWGNHRTRTLLHAGALASGIYERAPLLFDRPLLHGAVGDLVVQTAAPTSIQPPACRFPPAATCAASP